MTADRTAWVLHIDVDAFFAALEQRDDPHLRGRPVAVGTGVVASCSYEARPWGVRTGMRLIDARRQCPPLIVVAGDYRRYEIASRQILGLCHEYTPRVELAALDDLYLELRDLALGRAAALGRELAARVAAEVGVRVSLGLGSNKLVAAVATQTVKERKVRQTTGDDLAVVPAGAEAAYLAPWPVEVLPGVGHKANEVLAQLNVRTVAELLAMPPALLLRLFGPRGRTLRQLAQGIDPRPVRPSRPAGSISRCTSFDPPVGRWTVLTAMLNHLVERATATLRGQGQAARGVTVRLRYADHEWSDGRTALPAASDDEVLLKRTARTRLARVYARRLPLRLLGVELSPLTAPDRQGELFPDPERERQRRLRTCQDEVRRRFGFMALTSGTALELKGTLEHDRDNFRLRTPCLTR